MKKHPLTLFLLLTTLMAFSQEKVSEKLNVDNPKKSEQVIAEKSRTNTSSAPNTKRANLVSLTEIKKKLLAQHEENKKKQKNNIVVKNNNLKQRTVVLNINSTKKEE